MDEIDCIQIEIIELQEKINKLKKILETKLKMLDNKVINKESRQQKYPQRPPYFL